jgi:hypothetical protein
MGALNLQVLQGAGCALDADGHVRQRERVLELRSHVERVETRDGVLAVAFGPGVDHTLVDEFVAVEGECCRFLALRYERDERVLRIRTHDDQQHDVVDGFAAVFGGPAS